VPTSLSQIGLPAVIPSGNPSMGSDCKPDGQTELGTFSAILAAIDCASKGPASGNPLTNVAPFIGQALASSTPPVSTHSERPTGTANRESAVNSSGLPVPFSISVPVASAMSSPVLNKLPAPSQPQNSPIPKLSLNAAGKRGGNPIQATSDSPEKAEISTPSMPAPAKDSQQDTRIAPILTPIEPAAAKFGPEPDISAQQEASNSSAIASLSLSNPGVAPVESPAVPTETSTIGIVATPAASASTGVLTTELASVSTVFASSTTSWSSSHVAPKPASDDVPGSPIESAPTEKLEPRQESSTQNIGLAEANERPSERVAAEPRPAVRNETLAKPARPSGESRTDPSRTKSAFSAEIASLLAPVKDGEDPEVFRATDTTSATAPLPANRGDAATAALAEKTGETNQVAPSDLTPSHPQPDNTGESKSDSGNDVAGAGANTTAADLRISTEDSGTDSRSSISTSNPFNIAQTLTFSNEDKSPSPTPQATAGALTTEHPEPSPPNSPENLGSAAFTAYPTAVLSTAKLIERMGESELRLGIRSGDLGNVDIRTSMAHNQFMAEISVERGELGRALAAELPSLHDRLSEQRIAVGDIVLQNHTGGNSGSAQQQNQRAYARPLESRTDSHEKLDTSPLTVGRPTGFDHESRLDVHM